MGVISNKVKDREVGKTVVTLGTGLRASLMAPNHQEREFHPGFTEELAAAMEYLIILSSRGMG